MKRKLASIILTLSLCVGLVVPTFAAESETRIVYGDHAKITVTNVVKETTERLLLEDRTVFWVTAGNEVIFEPISQAYIEGGYTAWYESDTWKLGGGPGYSPYPEPGTNYFDIGVRDVPFETQNPDGSYTLRFYVPEDRQEDKDGGLIVYLGYGLYGSETIGVWITYTDANVTSVPEKPSSWAVEQVGVAIEANLVPENLQSKYTQATTRAEFASLAVTLYETITGTVIETGDNPFTDTNDINAIKAAAIKVTTGTTATTFSPQANLTREQAATMLSRLANAMGKPLPQQASTFNDNDSIATYALEAVGQMQVTEIMGGVGDNTFSPKSPYTREQSIMTIWRLFEIVK